METLQERCDRLTRMLTRCVELFDLVDETCADREDIVDGSDGRPSPNSWMHLRADIQPVREAAKKTLDMVEAPAVGDPAPINPMGFLCKEWLQDEAKRLIKKADAVGSAYRTEPVTRWTNKVCTAYRVAGNILRMEATQIEKDLNQPS